MAVLALAVFICCVHAAVRCCSPVVISVILLHAIGLFVYIQLRLQASAGLKAALADGCVIVWF